MPPRQKKRKKKGGTTVKQLRLSWSTCDFYDEYGNHVDKRIVYMNVEGDDVQDYLQNVTFKVGSNVLADFLECEVALENEAEVLQRFDELTHLEVRVFDPVITKDDLEAAKRTKLVLTSSECAVKSWQPFDWEKLFSS